MFPDEHISHSLGHNDHPFHLRRIDLEHFKSVDEASVNLSPLSVIVGTNSSGKSTLLQPILAISQAARARELAEYTLFSGELLQLGNYRDIQNFRVDQLEKRSRNTPTISRDERLQIEQPFGGPDDRMRIGLMFMMGQEQFDWRITMKEHGNRSQAMRLSLVEAMVTDDTSYTYITCSDSLEVKVMSLLEETTEARSLLSLSSSELGTIFDALGDGSMASEWSDTRQNLDEPDNPPDVSSPIVRDMSCSRIDLQVNDWFLADPEVIENISLPQHNVRIQDSHVGGNRWERRFLVEESYPLYLDEFVVDEESKWSRPLVAKVGDAMKEFFGSKVAYLGPLRALPEEMARADLMSGGTNLGKRGEYTAAVLDLTKDDVIQVPLPNGYEGRARLGEAMSSWLKWFGLADDFSVRRARRSVDLSVSPPDAPNSVDLSSVGVGVSQVLPVILLCLSSKAGDVLILEQPELHLHPALQKRMADFLLTFVRAGRQILVETHSDHLVNQLRYQIAADQTDQIKNLVKLVFADQADGITTYRESQVNEYGGLSEDWPDGFLDISTRSAQELVHHSLRKWTLRKPRPGDAN